MYLHLAFRTNSPVEHPELRYREHALMVVLVVTVVIMVVLLFVDIPVLTKIIELDG